MNCDNGKIILSNKTISNISMHYRSKLGVNYLPQEPSIFQNLTVYENLYGLAELSFSCKKDIRNFIDNSIEEFNLSEICNLKGRQLSGGQRRKVEIARTLAAKPNIILLDEPFAGIDPIAVSDLKQTINQLNRKDIGVLISDHNVRDTMNICSKVLVVNQGKIIADGEPSKIAQDSLVKEVYLGQDFQTN